ncbi:MAG: type I phosphomannose isomerase catalytic subunit [Thermomicrobiales bacterium]
MTDEVLTGSRRISLVRPRLDAKPWGGTALRQFGMDIADEEMIGEALVTANDAVITGGFGAGTTLGEIIADDPGHRLGELGLSIVGGRALFPLLVKLIDANQDLSIQVHPNDQQAAPLDRLGKTEAWVILDSRSDGRLYLGLQNPDDLAGFAAAAGLLDGSSASHLRSIPAAKGSVWLLPAGTIHALGAGVLVYEIQQPSDMTFRLDDWGRVDAFGNPREMHHEAGLAVARPDFQPSAIGSVRIESAGTDREVLVACRYFALERWDWHVAEGELLPESAAPQVLTVLEHSLEVGGFSLNTGESAVIWPGNGPVMLNSDNAIVLRGWIPDASDTCATGTSE